MNVYESIGLALVILMTLLGLSTCLYFMWHGYQRLRGFTHTGHLYEDAAVRDTLSDSFERRAAKGFAR